MQIRWEYVAKIYLYFSLYNWIDFIDSRMERGHCVPTLTTDDCNVLQEESWPNFEFLVTVNTSYCKEQSYQSYHLVFHNYYTSASAVFIETEICSRSPLISIIYVLQQKSIYMKFVYLKEILPIV